MRLQGPRESAWVGYFPFTLGVFQEMADDLSFVPDDAVDDVQKVLSEIEEVCARMRSSLDIYKVPF